jgi:hypothetical protein
MKPPAEPPLARFERLFPGFIAARTLGACERCAVNILAAYDAALAVPGTLFRPKSLDGDYYSIVDCVKASRSGKTLTFSLTPQ